MTVLQTRPADVPAALVDLPSLVDVAGEIAVIGGTVRAAEADRIFRLDPDLQAVAVQLDDGFAMLTREHLARVLDGRLGYGRALHSRSRVRDILPRESFSLPGQLPLIEAAERILARPARSRYQHVLVLSDEGPSVVTVSQVFERMSMVYRHVALHDPLTGLPNRRLLDLTGSTLAADDHDLSRIAILYIDLDGFKAVNDSFGHRVGDDILVGFAERLRTCVRPGDIVARLGGDEFAALLLDVSEVQAAAVADRVVLTATAPFVQHDQLVCLSASVGLAMATDITHETELTQVDVLLRLADGAMLKAKGAGKRRVGRLDAGSEMVPLARQSAIRRRLRDAFVTGSLSLHYQPKLDLRTDDCSSVEALMRWNDAELGPVSPAEFIPVAENGEEIHDLGAWVIEEACAQARRWIDAGEPRVIAVNISPKQLTRGHLVEGLLSAVQRHGIPASTLQVEITEGSAIVDVPRAVAQLAALREAGISVDLDDFGTGYSSLEMLHLLPLSAVKIDKAFIDNIDVSRAEALMVRGVIDAAHALGLRVVAEGVERAGQLDVLRELGCDAAQGYLISRPLPAVDLPSSFGI